jgi:HlyD family secretion protein
MKNKSNHRARRWVPYTGGVLLVALIVFGLWPRPVPVETARVSVGPLRATVNEEGKTRIRQRYVVSAPVTGQLERIPFKAGAEVQAGQVVAIIQPVAPTPLDARARTLAEARRDTAAANLDKARKAHEFAASELRRADKLFSDKTISPQEFDTFQWRETSAAKDLIVGEAALREAEAELAQFTPGSSSALSNCAPQQIKAPVSGQVLKVFEENARVMAAGAPLMELGDPSDLEVVIEVLSRDGATIVPGAKVEFEQWSSEAPVLEGRVRLIEPAAFTKVSALGVEEQRVNVIADLLAAPAQRRSLGDNFRVEARIVTWETNQTVKVPSGALFRHGSDWAAYVIKDGHAQLRVVEAGRSSGTETQILKGLQSGEEVILYPGSRVREGQRVRQMQV